MLCTVKFLGAYTTHCFLVKRSVNDSNQLSDQQHEVENSQLLTPQAA